MLIYIMQYDFNQPFWNGKISVRVFKKKKNKERKEKKKTLVILKWIVEPSVYDNLKLQIFLFSFLSKSSKRKMNFYRSFANY